MKKAYFTLATLFITALSFGQTTLYSQGFETDVTGYSHSPSQTPATDVGDQYFYRAEPSDPAIYESGGPYTGVTGSWLFVGSNPNAINGGTPGILSTGLIDVTGYENFELSIDFGAVPNDWDTSDELNVEYSWDDASWSTLYNFESPATNDPLVLADNATGGNNTGNGVTLIYALQTIVSTNFTGSGNNLYLRVLCDANANYEAFGLDNIILTGTAASSDPTVGFDFATSGVIETDTPDAFNIPVSMTNYDAPVTVTATVTGGTAEVGDYTLTTNTATFGADESKNIVLTINDDADTDDETVELTITVTSGTATLGTSVHTVTITDDEEPALTNALVITGVYDGPLTGGTPKGVELYVIDDIADLSLFGIGSANNGDGTNGEEFTFPAVSATTGDYIYVTNSADFTSFFGFAADYVDSSMAINGDDAVELFENGNVIDLFGDINTDGNGEAWEFLDGWAYRNTAGPSATFVDTEWDYSGINQLEGGVTNDATTSPFPIGTYYTAVLPVNRNQIEGFAMYPNPVVDGVFTIRSMSNAKMNVEIYDLLGKQVYNNTILASERIDVSNLTQGVYILRVEDEGKLATRKLVIQ